MTIDERTEITFNFNKQHLLDASIPMWMLKAKGVTHYLNHITIHPGIGFSTKETPDNPHTKAAIKLRGRLKIDSMKEAVIY